MPKKKMVPVEATTFTMTPEQLDIAMGRAMREFFLLYVGEKVDYMTAGSRKGTDDLTMILRPDRKAPIFCTFPTYEEVAECFISAVSEIIARHEDLIEEEREKKPF